MKVILLMMGICALGILSSAFIFGWNVVLHKMFVLFILFILLGLSYFVVFKNSK